MAISLWPRQSIHSPRNCEMPRLVSSSVCAATAPRHTSTLGSITSSCRSKYGEQVETSSSSGLRLSGGTALHDVTDVHVLPLQSHRLNHLGQQLPRAADKRNSLLVFIRAGSFANKNQPGLGISVSKHNLVSAFMEFAAGAFADVFANLQQSVALDFFRVGEQRNAGGSNARRSWRVETIFSGFGMRRGLAQRDLLIGNS